MSIRTCTVMCAAGPHGEMLRCGYKPGHKGEHSWASLPTFIYPARAGGLEIRKARRTVTATLGHHGLQITAMPEWWSAVCSSLGEDYPHVATIRAALEAKEEA